MLLRTRFAAALCLGFFALGHTSTALAQTPANASLYYVKANGSPGTLYARWQHQKVTLAQGGTYLLINGFELVDRNNFHIFHYLKYNAQGKEIAGGDLKVIAGPGDDITINNVVIQDLWTTVNGFPDSQPGPALKLRVYAK
jgi:hypothetical protein